MSAPAQDPLPGLVEHLESEGYHVEVTKVCPTCTHPIAEHTAGLTCKTCRNECGLNCSRWYR